MKRMVLVLFALMGMFVFGKPVSSMVAARNAVIASEREPEIPDIYREVKYLHGNGGTYLKVDFLKSTVNYVRYKFLWKAGTEKRKAFIGMVGGDPSPSIAQSVLAYDEYGKIAFAIPNNYNKTFQNSNNSIIDCTVDNGVVTVEVNGALVSTHTLGDASKAYWSCPYIFGRLSYSSPIACNVYLGRFEYYNAPGEPYSVLIPCVRKEDNKPGMYDKVRGVFYTNANTSISVDFEWE